MKFSEALQHIADLKGMITRDDWPYVLYFDRDGKLIIDDGRAELCTYSISQYDFQYVWKLKE